MGTSEAKREKASKKKKKERIQNVGWTIILSIIILIYLFCLAFFLTLSFYIGSK